jgi:serine protease Do
LDRAYGALVASTLPNSPAEKAGIKAGDIILDFNGSEVTEMRKLPRLVADADVNKNSKLVLWRNEKKINKNVLIAELKEEKVASKKEQDKKKIVEEAEEDKKIKYVLK